LDFADVDWDNLKPGTFEVIKFSSAQTDSNSNSHDKTSALGPQRHNRRDRTAEMDDEEEDEGNLMSDLIGQRMRKLGIENAGNLTGSSHNWL
jgi:hypothetical protein